MADEAKKTATKEKLSTRSTKQELLDAYTQVISQLEGQPVASAVVGTQRSLAQDTVRTLTDVKLQLSSQLDKLVEQLLKKLSDLQELIKQLEIERSQLLDQHREAKAKLDAARAEAQRTFESEQQTFTAAAEAAAQQRDLSRAREEEEYIYQLHLKRRDEEDTYRAERAALETALSARESALKDRESEIKAIERELAAVDSRIEGAVATATDTLRTELTAAHQQQLKEFQTNRIHTDELSAFKVAGLEATIKNQSTEIEQLKRQLESATRQLKEVAVSVIAGRAPQSSGGDSTDR